MAKQEMKATTANPGRRSGTGASPTLDLIASEAAVANPSHFTLHQYGGPRAVKPTPESRSGKMASASLDLADFQSSFKAQMAKQDGCD